MNEERKHILGYEGRGDQISPPPQLTSWLPGKDVPTENYCVPFSLCPFVVEQLLVSQVKVRGSDTHTCGGVFKSPQEFKNGFGMRCWWASDHRSHVLRIDTSIPQETDHWVTFPQRSHQECCLPSCDLLVSGLQEPGNHQVQMRSPVEGTLRSLMVCLDLFQSSSCYVSMELITSSSLVSAH